VKCRKIVTGSFILLLAVGCKWRDDFRDRDPLVLESTPVEQPERATLNIDSRDYTTNPIEEEAEAQEAPMPSIDCLVPIPEVPEYPSGL
jgi:hypothetical protein